MIAASHLSRDHPAHETTRGDAIAEELEEIAERLERLMPLITQARSTLAGLSGILAAGAPGCEHVRGSESFERLDRARMRIVRASREHSGRHS